MAIRLCRAHDPEPGHYWDTETEKSVPEDQVKPGYTPEMLCPSHFDELSAIDRNSNIPSMTREEYLERVGA